MNKIAPLVIKLQNVDSFAEVEDTIYDVFRAGYIVEDALEDGWQLTDLFKVLKVEPIVEEIVDDIPVFLQQFSKINPDVALEIIEKVEDRILQEITPGKIVTFVGNLLKEIAITAKFAFDTKAIAEQRIATFRAMFGGIGGEAKAA